MPSGQPELYARLMISLCGAPVDLVSPLPLDLCRGRLTAAMDGPRVLFGKKPVIGRVDGGRLRARQRLMYRNSFQTSLLADMVELAGRTRIRCVFALDPGAAVMLALMMGMVTVIAVPLALMFLAGLASAALGGGAWPSFALLTPVLLLLGFAAMVGMGRLLASGEREFLIAFVRRAVDAQVS